MEISYLRGDITGLRGNIGMMAAPGRARALAADLDELCGEHRCSALVSLTSDRELDLLHIAELPERAAERGLRLIRFPIGDFSTPDSIIDLVALVQQIIAIARSEATVVIHCWAGLGRTGLVAACCLVALGLTPEAAIAAVRQRRPGAVENSDQEECVAQLAATLASGDGMTSSRESPAQSALMSTDSGPFPDDS